MLVQTLYKDMVPPFASEHFQFGSDSEFTNLQGQQYAKACVIMCKYI